MPRPRKQPMPLSPEMEALVARAALGSAVLEAVKASGLIKARRKRQAKVTAIRRRVNKTLSAKSNGLDRKRRHVESPDERRLRERTIAEHERRADED